MLLDEFFPEFDVVERHSITIGASSGLVYRALRTADLTRSPLVLLLLGLRALPSWLSARLRRRIPAATHRPRSLADFEQRGFAVLAERPNQELLIGIQGRFWTLNGRLEPLDAPAARAPIPTGRARAGWNFCLHEIDLNRTVLTTETRVRCADGATRRRFRWYWTLIRPGSGLIRRAMLTSIRQTAERQVA